MTIDLRSVLSFVVLSFVWGSSFILIKKGLIAFDFVELGALRISISFLAFLPFFIKFFKEIDWKNWKYYLLVGLTGPGIPAFLYAIAQTEISSASTGVLNSLSPIFTLLIGFLFFKSGFQWSKFIGVIVGFIGAILLILLGKENAVGGQLWYSLFIIIGTIMYALNVNIVKSKFQNMKPIHLTTASFMSIGFPFFLYCILSDIPHKVVQHEYGLYSFLIIVLLALMGTVLALIMYYKLVQRTNAVFASSVAYTMPLVAIFWGFIDGEPITSYHFIGLVLILLGIYIIKK